MEREHGSSADALILDPTDPLEVARALVEHEFNDSGIPTIRFQGEEFHIWRRTHFDPVTYNYVSGRVWQFTHGRRTPSGLPFKPNRRIVDDVIEGLKSEVSIEASRIPCWLDVGQVDPPCRDSHGCVSFKNGLFGLSKKILLPHIPSFFNKSYLPFPYQENSEDPVEWLRFLQSAWNTDHESIDTLQEFFGYVLSGKTDLQKGLLIVGPKRSGKSTIVRIISALVGSENVSSPTLKHLGSNFGLQSSIGKSLITINDARLSGTADVTSISETLLQVIGEDRKTVARKNLPDFVGTLPGRFILSSNELPSFFDAAGAVASRFIVLRMTRSHFGSEDHGLFVRLSAELPQILSWSLRGLDRLLERGRFVQPASGADAAKELLATSSPVTSFVADRCVLDPSAWVDRDRIYVEWQQWCASEGRLGGSRDTFLRNLRAAFPEIEPLRRREGDLRPWAYKGIGLASATNQVQDGLAGPGPKMFTLKGPIENNLRPRPLDPPRPLHSVEPIIDFLDPALPGGTA